MRDSYQGMDALSLGTIKGDDVLFFTVTVAVSAGVSFVIFAMFFYWSRREQHRLHKKLLNAISDSGRGPEDLFLTGRDASAYGELVAQFSVNHGKQVISLLEAEGKRFIHVDGEISANERANMVRYLKSEGFMS